MHVRKKILTKYRIITSKSSADLLMPKTTWFTAFVRCNTKYIYKSKIRSKKKLNCDRETCNQSVEFHNESGRTDCIPWQTTKFIKLEIANNSFHTLQPAIFRVLKNKLTLLILKKFSHTYWLKDCWFIMSMLLGNLVKQFFGTASANPW